MLPPTPAAVAAYFTQRHGTLEAFTSDETRHNEWLWLVEICKLAESEAAALLQPPSLEAENGGSTSAEVIPVVQSPDPRCKACGQPFQPRREWSLYCSASCKQRVKRARRVMV
jgi:hypothetical protein